MDGDSTNRSERNVIYDLVQSLPFHWVPGRLHKQPGSFSQYHAEPDPEPRGVDSGSPALPASQLVLLAVKSGRVLFKTDGPNVK